MASDASWRTEFHGGGGVLGFCGDRGVCVCVCGLLDVEGDGDDMKLFDGDERGAGEPINEYRGWKRRLD